MSEGTEAPTPRRLARARAEGDGGASTAAAQALALVAAATLLPIAAIALADGAARSLRDALAAVARPRPTIAFEAGDFARSFLGLSAPILAAIAATAVIATLLQTGGVVATRKLAPDLGRLSPFSDGRRGSSSPRLFGGARAAATALVTGAVAWLALRDHLGDLARSTGDARHAWALSGALALVVLRRAALVAVALGAVDLLVVRRAWTKRLAMTRHEVKMDLREAEGDPEVRAARARAHEETARGASLVVIATANLVVSGRTTACALSYDRVRGDHAPVVVLVGPGVEVEREARAHGIFVVKSDTLARALALVEIGQEIPEEVYEAVAEAFRDARS